jgi:uncharacterized protein (TIGR04255 family)
MASQLLPEFRKPPVNEVALSVQFSAQPGPLSPHFGLFWSQSGLRSRFPKVEEQTALDPELEQFGAKPAPARPPFRLLEKVETPRCWFVTESGNELIQLQHDRLIHNWRRVGLDDPYPRYASIRDSFVAELSAFDKFTRAEALGAMTINQCEITYVNHLPKGEGWHGSGDVNELFSIWNAPNGMGFLPQPEDVRFDVRFRITDPNGEPTGRLRITLARAVRLKDQSEILVLTLIARGRPWASGVDGAVSFLDLGHEWIVRGFAEITTEAMHRLWGRTK